MLENCPFCGGEASAEGVVRFSGRHEAWFADGTRVKEAFYCNCMHCGVNNQNIVGGHQTREKAIAAWNRRAALCGAQDHNVVCDRAKGHFGDHCGSHNDMTRIW